MSRTNPTGSFVALVTPMNADGSIDFEGFRTLLNWHAENGTSAVLIMGSTGEVSMLSPEERKAIITETVKMKPGNMQMWYGITGNNTATTIDYARFTKDAGADGAIMAAPAYICADNDAIEDYAKEVLDSTDLPMGFYNNPPRVKTDLHWDNLLRLADHPNMVVLKESTTRVGQVAQVCAGGKDLSVMCCCSPNLGLIIPTMALGGHGTANMTGNIIPQEMATISTPWATGEDAFACRETYLRMLPILHFVYSAINPVALKTMMRQIGLPSGPLRKPLQPAKPEILQKGLDAWQALGLDEKYGLPVKSRLAAE
ncbi:4-hydroxy-tetrahydrodipicolinate synthase [Roseicyclus sp. F158]|uniref:4-hydroxy-tetrahydrodipicolinate synthase n=1 Tax=Tropicimonas omnivorans TaxID=3075590 RepID=A0ABU3DKW5_9RHOB|nr:MULTISPECIES: 4-hydroxy-tetrahydrodipicolinate synthase [Roseobacteraceae]MDT0684355.1 4-hydroxy-tetrahydrodipicolinate synthase [Roseicyclus sp. F158]